MTQAATEQATALKYKPKLEEMQIPVQDEEESDKASDDDISDDDSSVEVKKPSLEKSSNVYKAPKTTAVVYDDKSVKKSQQKEDYDRRKMSKTALVQELRREMADEPEEVHMGLGRKTKTSKYEDALEQLEQSQFKRVQMTKKEMRAIRSKREEEMQDRLENLDDDFRAVENILRHSGKQ